MSKKAELIGSHYPTIYLTVISLLQGIALSQLVPYIIRYLETVENPWTDIHVLPFLLMFLIIFLVWHHYAIGIFFLRWFPNIIDTIIPFIVSIGQFILISFLDFQTSVSDINMEAFTKGYAIYFILGSVAYFGAALRLEPALFTNLMSKQNAIIHGSLVRKYYNIEGWSILAQGFIAFFIVFMEQYSLLLISLIFFLAHIIVSEYFLLSKIRPHFDKALDEYEEA
jgi:hypothetical protein